MSRIDVAIIGGTGIGSRLAKLGGHALHVPTPFGLMRCRLVTHSGLNLALVQRHNTGHRTPPHHVNYPAMALGLRQLGAKACLGTAAVGSLRPEWSTGTMVACTDFVDITCRNLTLFESSVRHVDFSQPFDPVALDSLFKGASHCNVVLRTPATYIGANGPRYESPAEIQWMRGFGDIVGMTATSEAIAMREAGVPYANLSIVTNLAAGLETDVVLDHGDVVHAMEASGELAIKILLAAVEVLGHE